MTGVILSGGKNRRMGENKAFLQVNGERLIDRTVRLFRAVFQEVIIVTSSPSDYLDQDAVIVTDILPGKGALGGIYTGLFYAAEEHAFIAACDMPFLNRSFLEYMVRQTAGYDIIVPAPPRRPPAPPRCLHPPLPPGHPGTDREEPPEDYRLLSGTSTPHAFPGGHPLF